jgi:hypothetical protein
MDVQRYCAYDKLLQLALQIIEIHRDICTVNPYQQEYALPDHLANRRTQELYQLLIHSLTCIHHRQRELTREGKYISEEEDNRTALSLLQQILPLPQYSLWESDLILYKTLYEEYGTEKTFTVKEIRQQRHFKSETTRRIIGKLKKMGILKVVSGNRYKGGYHYKLAK